MGEEILSNLFRVEIPLPGNPLGTVNSYVIRSPGRNLNVDTGMDREACRTVMQTDMHDHKVEFSLMS